MRLEDASVANTASFFVQLDRWGRRSVLPLVQYPSTPQSSLGMFFSAVEIWHIAREPGKMYDGMIHAFNKAISRLGKESQVNA